MADEQSGIITGEKLANAFCVVSEGRTVNGAPDMHLEVYLDYTDAREVVRRAWKQGDVAVVVRTALVIVPDNEEGTE